MPDSSNHLTQTFLKLLYRLHLFRDFNFYSDYFTALKEIQNGTIRWKQRLRIVQMVLYYGTFHGIMLALIQDQIPPLANILLFNNMYLIGFNYAWNYVLGAFSFLGAHLYRLMYRENVGISAAILYSILICQSNEAFLWQYRAPVREVWRKFGKVKNGKNYKLQSNAYFIQWVAVYVRISLQGSLLLIVLQASSIQLRVWHRFYAMTTSDNVHFMLLALFYFELTSAFSLLMMRAFFHVMILTMATAALVIYIGSLQLEQFNAFSGSISSRRQLKRYHDHTVLALQFLTDVSRIYGTALFGTCLVAVPTVAMGLSQLMFRGKDIWFPWRVVMYIAGGLCGLVMFAVHFYGAYLTLLMKRPAKKMLALYVHSYTKFQEMRAIEEVKGFPEDLREFSERVDQEEQRRRSTLLNQAVGAFGVRCHKNQKVSKRRRVKWFELNDWRLRLKLAMHIEAFFSKDSPTLTYGRYGKVTYVSFGRELYYFFKILTFGYKVFNGR